MGSTSLSGFVVIVVQLKPSSFLHFEEQPSPSTVLPSSQFVGSIRSAGRSRPSPQADMQGPPVGGQTGSRRQNGEQPSPVTMLPSSHCSEPSLILFPQVVVVHVVGPTQPAAPPSAPPAAGDVQLQPSATATGLPSSVHCALQPSPSTMLPSSHCSLPATLPSPHLSARQSVLGGHTHPHSSVQSAAQPSPLFVLPSSQASIPSIMPSPQTTSCTQSSPTFVQV